jgi:hypothetical protein
MDEDAAIEAGWRFFLSQQGDIPFAAIVAAIRAQCPRVGVESIRAEFKRRLREWCGPAVEGSGRPVEAPGRPGESLSTKLTEARLLARRWVAPRLSGGRPLREVVAP